MKKIVIVIVILNIYAVFADTIDFNLYKLQSQEHTNKPVLLILSGIQGDEPGAFNATSIFIKYYKIKNGNIWVVPNLNQHSIIKNNRGIYGDMNRKFDNLKPSDPEYKIIENIKALILNDNIQTILHLHDGSGFYRERYINNLLNQNRWGNCSIIDQTSLIHEGDLYGGISSIVDYINENLIKELHRYRVRNTNTAINKNEQQKSLTYFATKNGKMAFANEASKNLPLEQRVYYHLLAIEGILKNLNIEFNRGFDFNLATIKSLIESKDINITIGGIIKLPLHNIKPTLNFFPIQKDKLDFKSNTPIIWLFEDKNKYRIKNGNKQVTTINPFFTQYDNSLESVKLIVDGNEIETPIGTIINVKNNFEIKELPYRVNIIGYHKEGKVSETDIMIKRADLINKFAIDTNNKKFRVEFYKQEEGGRDKFAGMIILDFSK